MHHVRIVFASAIAALLGFGAHATAQGAAEQTPTTPTQAAQGSIRLEVGQHGYRGFERLVMDDYLKAARGDELSRQRLVRACDAAIETDPRHAEAIAWRGAARMFEAAGASEAGDFMAAMNHVNAALNDLKAARELEPENPGVRIIAAQTLLNLAANHPIEAMAKNYARQGIDDARAGLAALHANWHEQPADLKGRLLVGVAHAYEQLGQAQPARDWYNRAIGAVPGSGWAQQAQARIDAMDRAAAEL